MRQRLSTDLRWYIGEAKPCKFSELALYRGFVVDGYPPYKYFKISDTQAASIGILQEIWPVDDEMTQARNFITLDENTIVHPIT